MNSKQYLKKCKQIASLPCVVNFRRHDGKTAKFPARRGEWVIPIKKVHFYVKLIKKEIIERMKSDSMYTMAEIRDEDIELWLNNNTLDSKWEKNKVFFVGKGYKQGSPRRTKYGVSIRRRKSRRIR